MHDLRLIHTDLKPENILLESSESVKIPNLKVHDLLQIGNFVIIRIILFYKNCWIIQRTNSGAMQYRCLPKSSAIKVIDFGSTAYDNQNHSSIVSTRHYRAPEVILGN